MTNLNDTTNRPCRFSCCAIGCISIAAFFLFILLWTASGFVFWKQCTIPLPHGSGKVIYMARLNKIMCAEWDRKVRIETNRLHSVSRWIPGDPGGADPVNVYWYPAKNGCGPYLRFRDPIREYMVDLKQGTTLLCKNESDGSVLVGEISTTFPKRGYFEDKSKDRLVETVDGHPMRRLEHFIASTPGTYLGRIEYPFNHFVPSTQSPEKKIKYAF